MCIVDSCPHSVMPYYCITFTKDIQPLEVFNFGGDEVSGDAWVNSTACDDLIARHPELEPDEYTPKNTMLHRYFVQNVSAIAADLGLDVAAWEDGMLFNKTPIARLVLKERH